MDVSIIIVNYNTKELLLNCLSSVIKETKNINYEIIVVDNNSCDNSVNKIRENFPQVKIIQLSDNIGFGRANNQGIKIANGKYIFCLNPDTLLISNAVKILFDFLEQNQNAGAVGGNLFDKNMKPAYSFGYGDDIISLFFRKTILKWVYRSEFKRIKNYEKNRDKTKIQEVNNVTGADLMIRKSVLDEVGCFNENFFMYFEETELETRIRRAGYKIFFVPESKIIHLEDKYRNNKHSSKYFYESFIEYYRICYGEAWAEIARFLIKKRMKRYEKL